MRLGDRPVTYIPPTTTLSAYTCLHTLCPSTLLSCAEHPRLCHKPTALSTAHAHMHRPTYPVYATRRPPSISSDLLYSLRAARRPSCYDVTQPTLPYPTQPASRPRLLQLPSSLARRGPKIKQDPAPPTLYPLPSIYSDVFARLNWLDSVEYAWLGTFEISNIEDTRPR